MIISKTPLRMSFVGGGSDIESFYKRNGGAVISTAIDKFIYINLNKKFDSGIRLAYSKVEEVENYRQVEHKLVNAALKLLKIQGGIEITSIADIPSKGSGLGSSSSFTVGLINVLNEYLKDPVSKIKLAEDSCKVEIDMCKEPIGKQDQYAAAFGGFNLIEFQENGLTNVKPLICKQETINKLEENTLMFYTGINRSASKILLNQTKNVERSQAKQNSLIKMVDLAYSLYKDLSDDNLSSFGEILNINWELKKSLNKDISNDFIDECYKAAINEGALGGKILGAGAGGFLMIYAPKEKHDQIKNKLNNMRNIPVKFYKSGSKIIYNNG